MKHCLNCGAPVSTDYARVFGDNDDQVHSCNECGQLSRGVEAKETGGIDSTTIS